MLLVWTKNVLLSTLYVPIMWICSHYSA